MPTMKPFVTGSLLLTLVTAAACAPETAPADAAPAPQREGTPLVLADTTLPIPVAVSAVAQPVQTATLSTKVMGAVTAVLVQAGDRVSAGQPLLRLDARDLSAKRVQVEASIAAAEAMQREAELMAGSLRALYADSAAPKAQLDAAEAGLARATAGLRAARAGLDELSAIESYATITAPFSGVVTQRFVDVGALAAPGAPLLIIEDHSRLRVSATTTADVAKGLRNGATLDATIEGVTVPATVEGVAPAPGRSLTVINALTSNRDGTLVPGGVATLAVPGAAQRVLLVPEAAIRREGDLTGVTVRGSNGDVTRWITLGRQVGAQREVLSGLRAGETILIPTGGAVASPAIATPAGN
jgi:RND family efflux transporter MFP subunit